MRVFFWLAIGFGAGLAVGVFLGRTYLIPAPSEPPQDPLRENVYPRAEQTVPDVSRPDGLGMLRAEVPQPAAPTPDPPGGDERAEDRQARVRRWQELSPQAMLREAVNLRRKRQDPESARAALDHLLGRRLPSAVRAQALMEIGRLALTAGKLQVAEAAFRRAVDQAVDAADERAFANYELALVLRQQERFAAALRAAEAGFAVVGTSKYVRVHCHWAVGVLAAATRDVARAQREFAAVLAFVAEDGDAYRWLVDDVQARQKRLSGR